MFSQEALCVYSCFDCNISCMMKIVDPKTGDEKPVTISVDDGIRANTSVSDLGKLKPVFKKNGTTTAGIEKCSKFFLEGYAAVLVLAYFTYMLFVL